METKKIAPGFVLILVFAAAFPIIVFGRMDSENYFIDPDSLDAGGGYSASANYVLHDAFGEGIAQSGGSANYGEEPFVASYLFRVFSLAAPSSVLFASRIVSAADQSTNGALSDVEVTDDGTAGWSLTMTSEHFTAIGPVKLLAGGNATVDFAGRYDGLDGVLNPNGAFVVEITTGGAVGTAEFKWTDPAGNVTTGVAVAAEALLSNGISVRFSEANYVVGDKWSVGVDALPYNGLTVTPGAVTVVSGNNGVAAGAAAALTGAGAVSDAKSLMTGESNNSAGAYRQSESFGLEIHANSLGGSFTANAVLTII